MNQVLRRRQRGAALAVSLIFLLLLTLVGVSAMQTSTMDERMAGNTLERATAFEAAESALRAGENWVNGLTSAPVADGSGSNGVWTLNTPAASWWTAGGTVLGAGTINGVMRQPKYVVEEQACVMGSDLGYAPACEYIVYRVTARGSGGTGTSPAVADLAVDPLARDFSSVLLQSSFASHLR